jgi:hypothetical protein
MHIYRARHVLAGNTPTIISMSQHSGGKSGEETSLKTTSFHQQAWKGRSITEGGSWISWRITGRKLAQYIQNMHILRLLS